MPLRVSAQVSAVQEVPGVPDVSPRALVDRLCALMRLTPTCDDRFVGESEDLGWPAVFGGQLLGQSLMAASHTVDADRAAHSMHAYFLLGVRPAPIDYTVERVRDGRSFSGRRVIARQNGRVVFEMSASFQTPAEGVEHQIATPPPTPGPEGLQSEREQRLALGERLPAYWRAESMQPQAIDYRPVSPVDLLDPLPCPANSAIWVRAVAPLPDDPALHRALLAYVSDNGLLPAAFRPHGLGLMQPGMRAASLDHAMWFHRDGRLDDWLLHAIDSPVGGNARVLCRGSLFDRGGRLLASTMQEGMLRVQRG